MALKMWSGVTNLSSNPRGAYVKMKSSSAVRSTSVTERSHTSLRSPYIPTYRPSISRSQPLCIRPTLHMGSASRNIQTGDVQ